MVEFDEVVMFSGEKRRVWMKRRSSSEIHGHGVLLHENSEVIVSFGAASVIDFDLRFAFSIWYYMIRQRRYLTATNINIIYVKDSSSM